MSVFGWSYPPGCSGPPEQPDPHPLSEKVCGLLEDAGVDQETIDEVCREIDILAGRADAECPQCMKRFFEEQQRHQQEAEEYYRSQESAPPLPPRNEG